MAPPDHHLPATLKPELATAADTHLVPALIAGAGRAASRACRPNSCTKLAKFSFLPQIIANHDSLSGLKFAICKDGLALPYVPSFFALLHGEFRHSLHSLS